MVDDLASDRANVWRTSYCSQRHLQGARQQLRIVVQEKNVLAACCAGCLVCTRQKMPVFAVDIGASSNQSLEELWRFVGGSIVNDDHFDVVAARFDDRSQASKREFRAIKED